MVDVDVNVKHPPVMLEQLEDGQDDVVGVAESGGLALFGVVQPAGPIDAHVGLALVELHRTADGAAGARL